MMGHHKVEYWEAVQRNLGYNGPPGTVQSACWGWAQESAFQSPGDFKDHERGLQDSRAVGQTPPLTRQTQVPLSSPTSPYKVTFLNILEKHLTRSLVFHF